MVDNFSDKVDLMRIKLRFYGISLDDFEDSVEDSDFQLVFLYLGLVVIESVAYPAESFYLQRVSFPSFVRSVFPPQCGKQIDTSFEGNLEKLLLVCPEFYHEIMSWPVCTR